MGVYNIKINKILTSTNLLQVVEAARSETEANKRQRTTMKAGREQQAKQGTGTGYREQTTQMKELIREQTAATNCENQVAKHHMDKQEGHTTRETQ